MFEPKIALKDIIIEYLREKQESISGVRKRLEADGIKQNRLIVAGYLKALADLGLVKETEVKPAKVYSLNQTSKKSIYEVIGGEIKKCKLAHLKEAGVAIHCLEKLFSRAIFLEELKRCGLTPEVIDANQVKGKERAKARAKLAKCKMKLPFNDPAYLPKVDPDYPKLWEEIFIQAILQAYDAQNLRIGSEKGLD
jgi:hypothetical protein